IKIFEEFYFYLPNSFSPNNDNINDVFYGNFIGMKSIEISIFNRWGELIYSSENLDFSWDGTFKDKQVPIGTYTWMLKYKRNGFRNNLIVGHVNLIR
ncbi:MAG: gliding motility-associated C-terminal domain-containing protein, partial [Crocinitomicaceae bacterium]